MLINLASKGVSAKCVSSVDGSEPSDPADDSTVLVAVKGSGITSVKDLAGKDIAEVQLTSLNSLAVEIPARQAGIDPTSIHQIAIPFAQMPAALAQGRVQAAVIVASFAANATSEGATVITHPNVDLFPNGTVTCLDAMGSYISANPTIVAEFRAAIDQAIEFFKAIPVIAILPIGLVLWGATLTMKFALVAFAVFWPLVVQVCYGVRSLDPVVRDTTTMLQVRGPRKFLTVILPSAAPFIATGLRVAVAVALIVDVIAELIGGTGIGERILLAENAGPSDYPQMYAYIVVAGILGVLLSQVVKSLWTQWVTGPARAELAVSLEHLLVGYVIAALVGIGVVFQDYGRSLYPWLTVARNVDLPLRVRGVPRPSARSGWPRCWRRSGWPTRAGATRGSCPAACSSGWRSPARSPTGPTCCSWTSRSRRWTRRPALSLRT